MGLVRAMCGICGIYDPNPEVVLSPELLSGMVESLIHRGPDGQGMIVEGGLGLGHTRLMIIDLVTGHQPMESPDGRAVIVFNGEIYNFKELRRDLLAKGFKFNTSSDTEVILNLYRARGLESIRLLNGIFALALWDRDRKQLVLARDRLGIKPLYYSILNQNRVIFGSEVKAILASGEVGPEVNHQALWDLFTFQNILGSKTLFSGVELLEPASLLVIDQDGHRKERYWQLSFDESNDKDIDYYRERLWYTFNQAVERQLVSDVPVGGYLSGGMDSGSVVATAARHIRPLHTFTCGFDISNVSQQETLFDERVKAEKLSQLLDTQHHECFLFPGAMQEVVDKLV